MKEEMKRVLFLLGVGLVAKLRKASYDRHESMSSIVRKAIEAYLHDPTKKQ